jgi:hypothetical protein
VKSNFIPFINRSFCHLYALIVTQKIIQKKTIKSNIGFELFNAFHTFSQSTFHTMKLHKAIVKKSLRKNISRLFILFVTFEDPGIKTLFSVFYNFCRHFDGDGLIRYILSHHGSSSPKCIYRWLSSAYVAGQKPLPGAFVRRLVKFQYHIFNDRARWIGWIIN